MMITSHADVNRQVTTTSRTRQVHHQRCNSTWYMTVNRPVYSFYIAVLALICVIFSTAQPIYTKFDSLHTFFFLGSHQSSILRQLLEHGRQQSGTYRFNITVFIEMYVLYQLAFPPTRSSWIYWQLLVFSSKHYRLENICKILQLNCYFKLYRRTTTSRVYIEPIRW